jgi:hypothetical protein
MPRTQALASINALAQTILDAGDLRLPLDA